MSYQPIYTVIAGNTVLDYLTVISIFIVFLISFGLIQKIIVKFLQKAANKTSNHLDNAFISMLSSINPPFYSFIAFYIATRYLEIEGRPNTILNIILVTWLAYQLILAAQVFIDFFIKKRLVNNKDRSSEVVGEVLKGGSRIALWGLGILFVLSNIGVNITSLVAGLGIGGIAIALAAQNVLGDLFSSLAIYFDKPFAPGEFIVMGDVSGTVQKVGIKTTRIKSLSGQEIVIPNNEMTSAIINNYARMERRRILFTFGVVYETSSDKMTRALELVKETVEAIEKVTFDRVHFKEFADSSLDFEVVYHVESPEYGLYMDIHQEILLNIKKKFEAEGIKMALPTQTIYVNKKT